MKKNLIEILACPSCGSKLELEAIDFSSTEVEKGELLCPGCGRGYLIEEGIPRFLTEEPEDSEEVRHQEVRQANLLYHDMIAEHYEEDESLAGSHDQYNQRRVENIVRNLSVESGGSLFLDLGCGTGNVLKFGQKYFAEVVGVDLSLNMLRIANSRGNEVMQADALHLPFLSEIFDCVSCFSVVHHIYDQRPFFGEIHRVLKEGGRLYTDWDPVSRPRIDQRELRWKIFSAAKRCYKGMEMLWHGEGVKWKSDRAETTCNFRESNPDSRELYNLAEYHLPSDGCGGEGIDLCDLRRDLGELGFTSIEPTFHWNGKAFGELPRKQRLNVRVMQLFNLLPKDFAENIQVIARKG
jgi:ubiquinone/menaquinone biosynthesis C-methylase UbiE